LRLHEQVRDRLDDIESIVLQTQESAARIINKNGPLDNPADRDHCLQYMVAVPLIFGHLTADDYEDEVASDPRIDALRGKMVVEENVRFSREYLEPDKRAIGNAVQVFFKDGTATENISVDYPVGHRRRRAEGIPLLVEKFERHLRGRISDKKAERILDICADQQRFEQTTVDEMMGLLQL